MAAVVVLAGFGAVVLGVGHQHPASPLSGARRAPLRRAATALERRSMPARRGDRLTARAGAVAASFDASGATLAVRGGTMKLRLASVGRGTRATSLPRIRPLVTAGRVTFERGAVREWYRAAPLGIEQGFTLSRRPGGGRGAVRLGMALGGPVTPSRRRGAIFLRPRGGGAGLRYAGVAAEDAADRRLPVHLALAGGALALTISDRHARYPITVDPVISSAAALVPDDAGDDAGLPASTALSADGQTAVVGSPGDRRFAGGAWIFRREDGAWVQEAHLRPSDEAGRSQFGFSVAVSADGGTVLIGGPQDHGEYNPNDYEDGAAWVFVSRDGHWQQQGGRLRPADGRAGAVGSSVALSGDGDVAALGGRASWVFRRSDGAWHQDGAELDPHGDPALPGALTTVALSGDGQTLIAGRPDQAGGHGAAWIYHRNGDWRQQSGRLSVDDKPGARFGDALALSAQGDVALVDQSGLGWVYRRTGTDWSAAPERLFPHDSLDAYGTGERAVGASLSADGQVAMLGGSRQGAMTGWLFSRSSGGAWDPAPKSVPLGAAGAVGGAVGLSGDGRTAVVGGNVVDLGGMR